jgi:hypothetical protein
MEINFGTQFTHDPNKGRDYSLATDTCPEPIIINVPAKGMTDNELLEFQRKERNIQNAWIAAADRQKTFELNANAHAQAFKSQKAALKAGTEEQGVKQEFATYQSAVMATNYAELKVGVDRERYQVMGQTLFVELAQAKVDQSTAVLDLLQSAHDLITHRRVRVLNGVPVDGQDGVGAVPELEYQALAAQLPPADFNVPVDLNEFMEKFKSQNRDAA